MTDVMTRTLSPGDLFDFFGSDTPEMMITRCADSSADSRHHVMSLIHLGLIRACVDASDTVSKVLCAPNAETDR